MLPENRRRGHNSSHPPNEAQQTWIALGLIVGILVLAVLVLALVSEAATLAAA